MAKTKQFTITIDNQPGAVARIAKTLGDVTGETVPTVPAHGRSESQTVFEGVRGWNAKKKSEEDGQHQTTCFVRKIFHEILSAYSHFLFFGMQR